MTKTRLKYSITCLYFNKYKFKVNLIKIDFHNTKQFLVFYKFK